MRALRRFINTGRDNRGATIVVVLVAMAFVTVLAAVLMFSSYTVYRMKLTERKSGQNFYDAEAIVNEIRAGVQLAVSDSISSAYTRLLLRYADALESDTAFSEYFFDELALWSTKVTRTTVLENGTESYEQVTLPLITKHLAGAVTTYTYNPEVLSSFINEAEGVSVVSATPNNFGMGEAVFESRRAVLKDVKLIYIEDGYETDVTVDLVVAAPDFDYSVSDILLTSLPNFSVIAEKGIQIDSGKLTIGGNAFAGVEDGGTVSLSVSGAANGLELGGSNMLITSGRLIAANGASINTQSDSSLWTQRLMLTGNSGSSAVLTGETYVADDLELAGLSSEATISGRYYGFGMSLTDPSKSSSIIVNGKETSIDIRDDISYLYLAGNSFINANNTASVLMGESLSVKSDQLAYLIPANCIAGVTSNPVIFNNTDIDTEAERAALLGAVDMNVTLWSIDGQARTLGYYLNAADSSSGVQMLYYPLPGSQTQTIVYYYMKFLEVSHANEYFRDYFTINSGNIEYYMSVYSKGISIAARQAQVSISGHMVEYSVDDYYELLQATAYPSAATASRCASMYANLTATLSANVSGTYTVINEGGETVQKQYTPYEYVLSSKRLGTVTQKREFSGNSGVVAVIYDQASVDLAALVDIYPNLKVLITTGDVIVSENFDGLIISGGKVTVSQTASLNADRDGVTAAFDAANSQPITGFQNGTILKDYLRSASDNTGSQSVALGVQDWNMERLVSYENWRKN